MDKSGKKPEAPKVGMFAALTPQTKSRMSEERYVLEFNREQRREKEVVLDKKIQHAQRRKDLGLSDSYDKWRLEQYLERRTNVDSVWILPNYIVVKCGSEMKYISRKSDGLFSNNKPIDFNINFGSEVWIQDVYTTGVDDLIQFMIIND